METSLAVSTLSALAHDTRLEAFRLLVRAGTNGVPAGKIAKELGIPPATLSFHLAQLVQAGLASSDRQSRSILYSLRIDGIRGLIQFLTEDCCQGRPELCSPGGTCDTAREGCSS